MSQLGLSSVWIHFSVQCSQDEVLFFSMPGTHIPSNLYSKLFISLLIQMLCFLYIRFTYSFVESIMFHWNMCLFFPKYTVSYLLWLCYLSFLPYKFQHEFQKLLKKIDIVLFGVRFNFQLIWGDQIFYLLNGSHSKTCNFSQCIQIFFYPLIEFEYFFTES